ncbi:hypothetical protein AYI69_g2193 [Smittium culicis]|uniref:Uncharacterized protein n=1 Tax=Smittium culicis TaxID=133412 RepID=A0A1R1YN72_9FUNG|nr:hypothetical protein AYI69_g2193 [Smittium culicis]
MTTHPYDIILGANYIAASNSAYDPTTMITLFDQVDKIDTFKMMPSYLKAPDAALLAFAASAVDCLKKADLEIVGILRDVAIMFDPTPSIVCTDFTHQIRLTID